MIPDNAPDEPATRINCVSSDPLDFLSQDNPYTRILAKVVCEHRLFSVHWELTYRCNQACTHCYLDVLPPNAPTPGELTTDQAVRVLDQIDALGALYLTFSGGEALVRRDFFEIAEYARRKRLAIRLMTNGILINSQVAERIANLHPTGVEISLYGADAATHDAITRRPHSFDMTLRAFQLLREHGIHTVMKTPLMRENVRQMSALRTLAARIGATFRCDPTITAKDNGDTRPLKHRLTYNDLVGWLRAEINVDECVPLPPIGATQRSCGIGSNSLVIDPYGNVFPCVQTRICAGNLRTQSVQEVWSSSSVFRELGALTWSKLSVCGLCELKQICSRCHGIAFVENGDLRAPSTVNCGEAMARRQVLIEKGMLSPDFPIPAHLKNGGTLKTH